MRFSTALKSTLFISLLCFVAIANPSNWDGKLVEWATMREAIGQGQFQARGTFAEYTSQPHFYGLGAVAGLKGEATVIDSQLVATEVSCCGNMIALKKEASEQLEGTYLLGTYVEDWNRTQVESNLNLLALEGKLREMASAQDWANAAAFPFLLEGELLDVKIHVINGACPMHARLNELQIPKDKKPFEKNYDRVQGKVLGFFADNSVGKHTHPGTSIHAHVLFKDPESGANVTGHLERLIVGEGSSLSLPR